MNTKICTVIVLLLFASFPLIAQTTFDSTEVQAEVPALNDFHDVIYPIWHVAYPSKDYTALRNYAEDVNKASQKIYEAKLPGILQDKQEMWDKGVDEFKIATEEYKKIAAGNDDEMLLKAAENLHSKFESLVKIVHPVISELDQFHQVLYMIYHKYLPQENYQQIYNESDQLVNKATALSKVKLRKNDPEMQKKFDTYSLQLIHATEKLREQLKSNNNEMVKYGVEDVHSIYQEIEGLFNQQIK
ncbi:MAG TPA: hypothetical protein VLB50_02785 [Ignavibacteriaceae bacterium]|nr:hypothetical protein [Ignavibacteriaceae bacterium]